MLALTETKLKGNGEVSWCGVNDIITGVQEMKRARERVATLLNEVWHSAVIDIWIKLKFSRVKVCVGEGGTAPMNEMVKKGTDAGTTWTGYWITSGMDIDCAFWEI